MWRIALTKDRQQMCILLLKILKITRNKLFCFVGSLQLTLSVRAVLA